MKMNLEKMLEKCGYWRGVSYLAHRVLGELDWFASNLIFGHGAKILEANPELLKYPKFVEKITHADYDKKHPFRPFIKLFYEYCEILYVKEEDCGSGWMDVEINNLEMERKSKEEGKNDH